MSTQHSIRAEKFLADKKQAEWHDETLWLVRAKRDRLRCGVCHKNVFQQPSGRVVDRV